MGPNPNAGSSGDEGTESATGSTDETDDSGTGTGSEETGDPDPSCEDEAKNGDETDVDCGGDLCDPCADGDACEQPKDCESMVCDVECVAATCDDEVLNGEEALVDCGGACDVCVLDALHDDWADPDEDLETQPAVHMLPNGRFAIAWVTVALDVRFRWFDQDAENPSDGFLAHGVTVPEERRPMVRIRDAVGPELVLAYLDLNPPDGPDVIMRRFDLSGGATQGPVTIDTFNAVDVEGFAFDVDGDEAAFTWHGGGWMLARRYDLKANTFVEQEDLDLGAKVVAEPVSLAYGSDGGFVAAWTEDRLDFDFDAYVRARTAGGSWAHEPAPANAETDAIQTDAVVAHLSNGDFVVIWAGASTTDPAGGVVGRIVDATGTPSGADIQINEILEGMQERPSVVGLADGFAVAWQDANTQTVRLRRFANDGTPKHDDEAPWGSTAELQPQAPALAANDEQIVMLWAAGKPDVEIVGVRLAY